MITYVCTSFILTGSHTSSSLAITVASWYLYYLHKIRCLLVTLPSWITHTYIRMYYKVYWRNQAKYKVFIKFNKNLSIWISYDNRLGKN